MHPPLGKLFIAFGEWTFGLNSFGWRFSTALIGTLAILLLARITRRMTRSTLLGCVAGLLMALDGLEFVMSRTALLDIFLMFWVLAAFGCLVVDRDLTRARLAGGGGPASRRDGFDGPRVWVTAGGGSAPGSAWAWPWPRSGTRSGTCSGWPPWSSRWDCGARRAGRACRGGLLAALKQNRWLPAWFGVLPDRGVPGHLVRLVLHQLRLRPAVGRVRTASTPR